MHVTFAMWLVNLQFEKEKMIEKKSSIEFLSLSLLGRNAKDIEICFKYQEVLH